MGAETAASEAPWRRCHEGCWLGRIGRILKCKAEGTYTAG